ncbi:hypothetical protein C7J99_18535 [Brevibacillus brevis]|nr:hypothetical protein C7J99_18535 [Brevibacillus brevis]
MFSSRLYPHYVRAVSFQTCDTPSRTAVWVARFELLVRVGACRRFRLKYKKSLFKEALFSSLLLLLFSYEYIFQRLSQSL